MSLTFVLLNSAEGNEVANNNVFPIHNIIRDYINKLGRNRAYNILAVPSLRCNNLVDLAVVYCLAFYFGYLSQIGYLLPYLFELLYEFENMVFSTVSYFT